MNSEKEADNGGGCWTSRRIDSLVILVVDALRFDFARDHLPLSVGSRLFPGSKKDGTRGYSRLYQFVADPPTVTMQRLKALTTGGLPTFADITGSFGGANIEEDSWVEQLIATRNHRAGHQTINNTLSQIAFVGDDTWVDLFPTQFDDCHPYPSFNTRDLDTVDNGCLLHLPRLLDGLIGLNRNATRTNSNSSDFELIIAHFLGVDHVGHTYGPNDSQMDKKLHQMDVMLSHSMGVIDAAPHTSCVGTFVFGDHGMTEDGNHGGGTNEERNAGLFVHYSPGCKLEHDKKLDGSEVGTDSIKSFNSINQIDLVPTISLLLGLPIPYANIGGIVPELLPVPRQIVTEGSSESDFTSHATVALALNAGQVWSYFDDYSKISRDLPLGKLDELKELLDSATLVFKEALADAIYQSKQGHTLNDSMSFRQACSLYKLFLAESTDLGKRVWTQFNESGMMLGIGILAIAWFAAFPLWRKSIRQHMSGLLFSGKDIVDGTYKKGKTKTHINGSSNSLISLTKNYRREEVTASLIFMVFHCGILTFGNSYIDNEREVIAFCLSVLCLMVFRRLFFATLVRERTVFLPLIVAICARLNDLLATGHGLDPSIRLHVAHHSVVFVSSLIILAYLRFAWLSSSGSAAIDTIAIIFLAFSWWEKRLRDHSRNGFYYARIAIALAALGLSHSVYKILRNMRQRVPKDWQQLVQLALFRVMIFIVIFTGPSTASTGVLIFVQTAALSNMMQSSGTKSIDAPVIAAMWRLAIRHVFFATNHHCSFNRLHYSAAFVATDTFMFHVAGSSLFMNTFGWEIVGSALVMSLSRCNADADGCSEKKSKYSNTMNAWHWFLFYQWTEILSSCISVSLMKRHLMVWAIFAPRFMFSAVFTCCI